MLKINNNKYIDYNGEMIFVPAKLNNRDGYSVNISIKFSLGYINFYVDYFQNNDFYQLENKKYSVLNDMSKIVLIEILENNNLIDRINGPIELSFGLIKDEYIEINFSMNDIHNSLKYDGLLSLQNN